MEKRTKSISVLIPDGESHLLIYIVNCFSLTKEIKLYVMSNKSNNPLRYSRHVTKFLFDKNVENDSDWINAINNHIEKYEIDLVLPIFEDGIKRLIKNQGSISFKNKICSLPDLNIFNKARNKGLLYGHLEEINIPRPKSFIINKGDVPSKKDLKFPVIIKPSEGYGGGIGVKYFNNYVDIISYYNEQSFNCNTLVQEYIKGYDVSVNVLCENGDIIAYSIQKGLAFVKGELTPQTEFIFIENKELFELVKFLLKTLNWCGVANIDCRYDVNDKRFKIIEINTRFWLNTDASAIAGVNFPYLHCLSSLNTMDNKLHKANLITYYSLKGLVRKIKTNPSFILTKAMFNNSPLKFAFLDPIPVIYKFIWRTKNIVLSRIKR